MLIYQSLLRYAYLCVQTRRGSKKIMRTEHAQRAGQAGSEDAPLYGIRGNTWIPSWIRRCQKQLSYAARKRRYWGLDRCDCRLTCRCLSDTFMPLSVWIASSAPWGSAKLTKPTPLHLPVCSSWRTFTLRMAPCGANLKLTV